MQPHTHKAFLAAFSHDQHKVFPKLISVDTMALLLDIYCMYSVTQSDTTVCNVIQVIMKLYILTLRLKLMHAHILNILPSQVWQDRTKWLEIKQCNVVLYNKTFDYDFHNNYSIMEDEFTSLQQSHHIWLIDWPLSVYICPYLYFICVIHFIFCN